MTAIEQEFITNKSNKVVCIGRDFSFHVYRGQIVETLLQSGLPTEVASIGKIEAVKTYAQALIGLNCSLNGDLNLRNLEIISSGALLLTDQLSPQSGFTKLFIPKEHCDVYRSPQELVEKAAYYYPEHPQEAMMIAHRAYQLFYEHLHPRYRINDLYDYNSEIA